MGIAGLIFGIFGLLVSLAGIINTFLEKYKKLHPEEPLPHITPHVYRHTFCTNMVNAGMDVKVLQ